MEHFEITKTNEGFHIEGFPEAVKVLGIKGPNARRLANLTLHKADLEFSLSCLDGINWCPRKQFVAGDIAGSDPPNRWVDLYCFR